MIGFWGAVALLIAVALWFVVRPLLAKRAKGDVARSAANIEIYRDQLRELDADLKSGVLAAEQHDKSRRELEARLLDDAAGNDTVASAPKPARRTAIALAAVVPIGAFGVYLAVGMPAALDPQVLADNAAEHSVSREQLEAMVERLAAKLKEDPENGQGWAMLARSYKVFGRYEDATRAYGNAVTRLAPDATLLADYADVLAMAQGQKLAGEPEKLIAQALKIDPHNLKALALAGSAAFDRKDYAEAVRHWEQMLPLVPAGSEDARAIQANVEEARGLGGIAGSKPASVAKAGPIQGGVSGVVQLAPELANKVAPTDTVLIYARAAEGSRMPLAIVRKQVRELPVTFKLDDTSAMQPGMTVSKHERVIIAARVSKSSSASPQPGDFEGTSTPVRNTASGVTVVIDSPIR